LQEKNTSHFELERSYDGIAWVTIGKNVTAQGYATQQTNYQIIDQNVNAQLAYYRINQVDLDGVFSYSDVLRVHNLHVPKGFLPFPNPTVDNIRFFSKTEVVQVDLISNHYSVYREMDFARVHDNMYELDLTVMKSGNYIFTVHQRDGEKMFLKIIKK